MTEERTPFFVHCDACRHEWPAFYAPMAPFAAAKLLKRADRCPMCASTLIFVGAAPQPDPAQDAIWTEEMRRYAEGMTMARAENIKPLTYADVPGPRETRKTKWDSADPAGLPNAHNEPLVLDPEAFLNGGHGMAGLEDMGTPGEGET